MMTISVIILFAIEWIQFHKHYQIGERGMNMKEVLLKILKIMAGTFLMAAAVNFVYEPMQMVTGGISGLAIVIKELTKGYIRGGLPVWFVNIALNIPIFIWGYFAKGKSFLKYTIFANLCFSFFMMILPVSVIEQKDYVLSVIVGGVLTGIGLGLVFASGYSTGGTDLLSSILHTYLKQYPVAALLFVLDALIIFAGALIFGVLSTIYAVIAVFLTSKLMDDILSGLKVGKQVWVISEKYQQISNVIMEKMDRGVTCLEGVGMYSENTKNVLLCVVGKREIVQLVQIVREKDPSAFVIIQDAREVMGEGFGKIE